MGAAAACSAFEFFLRFDIESTDLSEHLFRLMNVVEDHESGDKRVMLDFTEFFCGIYHFCCA